MGHSLPPTPDLAELPPPPPDRRGWPWTEGSARVGPSPAAGGAWPSITVVVPSYRQAAFLEETLRSVLLQGYPALELLVMDGGSSDGSVDVIKKYERWLGGWVSEKDGGQSAAINKGWRRARGELITWLNSDDLLLPGWAAAAAGALASSPDVDLVYCDVSVIDGASRPQWVFPGHEPSVERQMVYWRTAFAQQGFLVRRSVIEQDGYLDESLHFAMDTELWLRLSLAGRRARAMGGTFAAFRMHEDAKTANSAHVSLANLLELTERFCRSAPPRFAHLVEPARKRMYWNAALGAYESHDYAAARRFVLRYLRDAGVRALPKAAGMVGFSFLGAQGHKLLALARRARGGDTVP
jgi:glycosyltransferase involved in cell wall biosynthesis